MATRANLSVVRLLGRWAIDPNDQESLGRLGRVTMEFRGDGLLDYTIHAEGKRQIMLFKFRVEDDVIVTDQPSSPREERTAFWITDDEHLILLHGGRTSSFVRDNDVGDQLLH